MLRPLSDIENSPVDNEDQLQQALRDLAEHAVLNPALRLLLIVLSDEPGEVAAGRAREIETLTHVLEGDSRDICEVAHSLLIDYSIER